MCLGTELCMCVSVSGGVDFRGKEEYPSKSCFRFFGGKSHFYCLHSTVPSIDLTLKAALLIQRWYRRYCARLEIRRRYTWTIFQTIEYAGEQDQMKLYNFFNALITHMGGGGMNDIMEALSPRSSPTSDGPTSELSMKKMIDSNILEDVPIEANYKGPHLKMPLNTDQIHELVDSFKKKKALHVKYVYLILREGVRILRQRSTIVHISTAIAGQITVCGDLHGKLDDLIMILYKNGLPSTDNPYLFNGDFVDRGRRSMEVMLLLLALLITYPNEFYLNRGNHEDMVMNARYGFCKEISRKYKAPHGPRILRLLEEVYRWLPLASIIDNRVFVVHGGISEDTDLKWIQMIDRSKYTSLLRTPVAHLSSNHEGKEEESQDEEEDETCKEVRKITANFEWKQVLDLLWSDPQSNKGSKPNHFRGGGSYYGPDITQNILSSNGLSMLIRSHECKPEGYEWTHNGICLTIFSASNYYEAGSNRGAYVKLIGNKLEPHFVQYSADSRTRKLTIRERVGRMETSAFRELRGQIIANRTKLQSEFKKHDPNSTGYISVGTWVAVLDEHSHLDLPWRSLRDKLVEVHPTSDLVDYNSTFEDQNLTNENGIKGGPTVVEALYRHKDSLETIFRLIDKDNSGKISMEEFSETCELLSRHIEVPIPTDDIGDLARSIDINKDGLIDFNEFLECFRIVQSSQHGKEEDEEDDDD
ncbi:unnamed protein product, partial [Meganyctiphanes norvegica]